LIKLLTGIIQRWISVRSRHNSEMSRDVVAVKLFRMIHLEMGCID